MFGFGAPREDMGSTRQWLSKAKNRDVKIIVTNGYQMHVRIVNIDEKAVVVRDLKDGLEKLLFIHAISTVQPYTDDKPERATC